MKDANSCIKNCFLSVIPLVALSIAASGCGNAGGSGAGVVVRDSSGIEIVDNHGPIWVEGDQWRISEDPIATIGSDDASEDYSLFRVRSAARLPNGDIVIANSGSHQLKFYGSDGRFIRAVGREGGGPGEFRRMWRVWVAGDSIFASDFTLGRVTSYSIAGEFGQTMTLEQTPSSIGTTAVGAFSDGSMLGFEFHIDRSAVRQEGMHYASRDFLFRRYSRNGSISDSLGVFHSGESVQEMTTITNPTTGETGHGMVSASAPFGHIGTTTAHGDFLYHGTGRSYEVQVFTSAGTLARLIRRLIPNPAVTDQDVEQFRKDWLEGTNDWMHRVLPDLEIPETKPAYGTLKVDALGNLWVAEYSIGRERNTGLWTVFDPDGRMLGEVRIPPAGSVLDIGDDFLLGVWRTDLDVEQVRLYGLTKGDVGVTLN